MSREAAEHAVSDGLRELTRRLGEAGAWTSGGLLGGEDGYGAWFENHVFLMHPYCWCEQDDCPWCVLCACPDEALRYFLGDREIDADMFYDERIYSRPDGRVETVPDRQCWSCREKFQSAPNFLHKPTGTTVSWYKYIGRSMDVSLRGDWGEILSECLASVPEHIDPDTVVVRFEHDLSGARPGEPVPKPISPVYRR